MASSNRYSIPIPQGYRIFHKEMEVSGVGFRKEAALKALTGKTVDLSIESEPSNKHDPNALKLIAHKKGWFRIKQLHIGYIPKAIAKEIAKASYSSPLLPRLKEVWVGDRGGLKIYIDILGKKSEYQGKNV